VRRETLWGRGSRVLFGQMYEDVELEMRAFEGCRRVFCIASAGCSAIALSGRHEVTAVDINADQLNYARSRAAGAPAGVGRAEHAMAAGRRLVRIAGWTPDRLEAFVNLSDCNEQLRVWRSQLARPLFRLLFDASIGGALSAVRLLTPLDSRLPARHFGLVMRTRLERGLARFENALNPYARRLFRGDRLERGEAGHRIRFEHADAAAYLEACPSGSFDAFSLSNILDGATASYAQRLRAAVHSAASPEAIVILRSFGEPRTPQEGTAAAEDRAMIWGSIYRGPAQSL